MMSKQIKRLKCPNQALAHYWQDTLKEVPASVTDALVTQSHELRPKQVWCNNQLMVMLYPLDDGALRLTVRLHEHKQGVLDWDALQKIKSDCGFGDYQAFEVYPEKRDVVNARDLRHLWIMPKGVKLDIGWIRKRDDYTVIEPFKVSKELEIATEQLDVFIKGGQWSTVSKHGYPKDERKKYVAICGFLGDTRNHIFIVRYSSLSGFAVPKGAIVTHYYAVLEMPEGVRL